jgi:hypothetical protein
MIFFDQNIFCIWYRLVFDDIDDDHDLYEPRPDWAKASMAVVTSAELGEFKKQL